MRQPFQRKDTGVWYYQYPSGKQVPLGRTEVWTNKSLPKEIERAWHALGVRQREPRDATIQDVADEYRQHVAGMGEGTRKKARLWLGWFLAFVGEKKKVSSLEPNELTRFLRSRNWGPSMTRSFLCKLNAALNHAVAERIIDANPFKSYKKPRYLRRKIVLAPEVIAAVEAASDARFRAVLIGLKESGCRPVELTRALVEKCDLAEGVLLVPNKAKHANGEEWRPVYLSPALKDLVRELTAGRETGFIWRNRDGNPWTVDALMHRMAVVRRKTGLKGVTLYAYRHTFASNAINERNVNPALVAKLLGHVDLTQLKIYFHENHDAMKEAAEQATKKDSK